MKTLRDIVVILDDLFVYIVGLFILYTIYIAVIHYYDETYQVALTVHNNREAY